MITPPLFGCSTVPPPLLSLRDILIFLFEVIQITVKELRILQTQGSAGYLNDELVNALLRIFVETYGGPGDRAITTFLFNSIEKGRPLRKLQKSLREVIGNCIGFGDRSIHVFFIFLHYRVRDGCLFLFIRRCIGA